MYVGTYCVYIIYIWHWYYSPNYMYMCMAGCLQLSACLVTGVDDWISAGFVVLGPGESSLQAESRGGQG